MLDRAPVVDFKTVWKLFINQDQPLEDFLACCTLVNTGAWASTVPVEGPGSASPRWKSLGSIPLFLVNMVELTWVSLTII